MKTDGSHAFLGVLRTHKYMISSTALIRLAPRKRPTAPPIETEIWSIYLSVDFEKAKAKLNSQNKTDFFFQMQESNVNNNNYEIINKSQIYQAEYLTII